MPSSILLPAPESEEVLVGGTESLRVPMGVSFAPNGLLVVDTVRLWETWWSFSPVESSG